MLVCYKTASCVFFCETFWGLRVPTLLGFIDGGASQRINATVQSCYGTQTHACEAYRTQNTSAADAVEQPSRSSAALLESSHTQ